MNTDHIQEFNRFITEKLNPDQHAAVTQDNGVLLVVAGAGSGKTRVITARIAHLMLNCNVHARQIVALTFTNKAAHEMRERIVSYLPAGNPLPFIGTFHAYCLRILKENKALLNVPFESILDEDDQKKIISNILERHNSSKKHAPKQLLYQISQIKNRALNPDAEWQLLNNPFLETVYTAYELEKTASRCLDFDDLLLHAHTLITTNALCGDRIRAQLKHILIDEYQDTNIVQHALLKALAKQDGIMTAHSICVVGDEDQSIYSWRGATVDNMLHFKKDFAHTTLIKIEQNYRSVQPILSAANALISHNRQRTPKELWSERNGSDRIRIVTCVSDRQEADVVAHTIATVRKHSPQRSIAILYRAHAVRSYGFTIRRK